MSSGKLSDLCRNHVFNGEYIVFLLKTGLTPSFLKRNGPMVEHRSLTAATIQEAPTEIFQNVVCSLTCRKILWAKAHYFAHVTVFLSHMQEAQSVGAHAMAVESTDATHKLKHIPVA